MGVFLFLAQLSERPSSVSRLLLTLSERLRITGFLHLLGQEKGLVQDEPIKRIMLALGRATLDEISEELARVDFAESLFLNEVCHALRKDAPYRLRRATIVFHRHLDAQFFDANKTFDNDQIAELVSKWSASTKESWDKYWRKLLSQH